MSFIPCISNECFLFMQIDFFSENLYNKHYFSCNLFFGNLVLFNHR